MKDSVVPLASDPFAFILERRQAFYATDFKRLLWSLPYYRGEVKVGSLLAAPVRTARWWPASCWPTSWRSRPSPARSPRCSRPSPSWPATPSGARASLGREELGQEFKAVYEVSQHLATREAWVRSTSCCFVPRGLVPFEGAAVVMKDDPRTPATRRRTEGWAKEFKGREVGLVERTWAAWVLRSREEAYLLDDLAGQQDSDAHPGAGRGRRRPSRCWRCRSGSATRRWVH